MAQAICYRLCLVAACARGKIKLGVTLGGRLNGVGVMEQMLWPIDFAFPFPAECTQEQLVAALELHAEKWPGWENFPWRVTRSVHEFLGRPPASFHYLMTHRCLVGYASHLVLTSKFENRQAVLDLILREKFEIVGMFRALLVDAIRAELHRTQRPYIEDCSGPDDKRIPAPPEELEKRRDAFRACVEKAVREFVQILDLASQANFMHERVLGRSLRSWACGGDMPEPMKVPVELMVTSGGKVVKPCKSEVLGILQLGMKLPKLVLREKKSVDCRLKSEGKSEDGRADGTVAGDAVSRRVRAKRAAAGRVHGAVKEPRDRKAIRAEVRRLKKLGLSQTEACRQVAEQAQKGRAGDHALTMRYDMAPCEATTSVVLRVVMARR